MTEAVDSHPSAAGSATGSVTGGPARLLPDDRLARRAAKGDQRAFAEIYRRYHQSLFAFCLAMVGSPQDAQDALQNTMIKVLRALPGEKRAIKLKPWLYRIARNEAIETVRRRRDSVDIDSEQRASPGEIAETVEARDRLRKLIDDLEELPERQRAALVMRELAGMDFDQIGATFETSAAVARQTVYEARLSLRQMDEGREMSCESVMQELSDADGRVIRRRAVRAHLRGCRNCRAFRDSIDERRTNLAAIAPLPLAASVGMLHGILGGSAGAAALGAGAAGGAGGGLAGSTVAAGAGKAVAASAIAKSAATVAVVAVVGVTAADRGGVIDVPLPGGDDTSVQGSHRASDAGPASPGAASKGKSEATAADRKGARDEGGSPNGAGRSGETAAKQRSGRGGGSQARGQQHAGNPGRQGPLPEAASRGQQTAAAHKSPNANVSPGTPPSREKTAPQPSSPPSKRAPAREQKDTQVAPVPEPQAPSVSDEKEAGTKGRNGVGGDSTEP